jgi:murein DD-endopeptidase MepM/ murein hydrolase activator NlpD
MGKGLAVIVVLLVILIAIPVALFVASDHSTMAFDPALKAIAAATPVAVHIVNPHGVRRVTARIEQNGVSTTIADETKPPTWLMFWRTHAPALEFRFTAGQKQAPQIKEGKARLIVEAQSNDLRGATDAVSTDVDVILRPPTVTADEFQHYINQGGSELAMFVPSGYWADAGVRVGDNAFRSFPAPGSDRQRFSLFAYPWDTPRDTAPVVYARNPAGAESTAHFWFKVFPKKFRARDLTIDDRFLDKVVNQIDPGGSGDLLARFLKINGEMRRANNKTLADLRFKTEERFPWTQAFLQLSNSKVESEFADVRSYVYKGKKVDQQVHLGFDLAVSAHTPVVAANDGKVVWAAPLGIYGNCIVLDHGYALQSIYGHLSEIGVKEGEAVKRGQVIGKSGATGLAGGDHLHFSMQVDGVQVNPIEWWDEHWIKDHIFGRVKPHL